jgi:hypothetical protein
MSRCTPDAPDAHAMQSDFFCASDNVHTGYFANGRARSALLIIKCSSAHMDGVHQRERPTEAVCHLLIRCADL